MPTSGSTNYTINRDRMKVLALTMSGELASGETMNASQSADINDMLNIMLKSMQSDGLKLWLRRRATVFLSYGINRYSLNSTGAYVAYSDSFTRTAIKVNAVATNTSIDINTTVGITTTGFIGFVMNDNTLYWTTATSVTDSDTVVIAAPGLPSAASVGNYVYYFETKIDRPLRILQAFHRDRSGSDTTVDIISQNDYMDLSTKEALGRPNQIHYDPQNNAGLLYVWPTPDDVRNTLELVVDRPIHDMDLSTDDFDVPQEWYEPILYGLAERAALHFHVNEKITVMLGQKAAIYLMRAMDGDVENASIFFSPRLRY